MATQLSNVSRQVRRSRTVSSESYRNLAELAGIWREAQDTVISLQLFRSAASTTADCFC